jgi:hypothetical protein
MEVSFSIAARAAWAPGLAGPSDWAEWAAGARAIEDSDSTPELSFLPSLFKRRLGPLDRMVLQAGHEALGGRAAAATVLATKYGEIGQQYKISDALARSGEVSPAAFSLSVFNAPASLLSISEHGRGGATTVHAGEASFSAGLICGLGLLAAASAPLLLVAADELVPEAYSSIQRDRGLPFAVAFLLESGGEGRETFRLRPALGGRPSSVGRPVEGGGPEALRFLRWLILGSEGELTLGEDWSGISISRSGGG